MAETAVAPETPADPQDSAPLSQGGRALAEAQARLRTGLLGAPSTGDLRWAGTELGLAAVCGPGSRGWGDDPGPHVGWGARGRAAGAPEPNRRPCAPLRRGAGPGLPAHSCRSSRSLLRGRRARPSCGVGPGPGPGPRASPRRLRCLLPAVILHLSRSGRNLSSAVTSAAACAKSSSGSLLGLQ